MDGWMAGKIKAIGLSNYSIEDYEELKSAGALGLGFILTGFLPVPGPCTMC